MAILKLALGWNRVMPPHELMHADNGFVECSELLNYISRDSKIKKIGGTYPYNPTDVTHPVPWTHRSYHKRGDGTFVKTTLCFANGVVYSGDDLTGALTARRTGLRTSAIPTSATMQVSGNSVMYLYTGFDEVVKYDGNGSYVFEDTTLNADLGRTIESAVVHLDRFWYVSKNSSILAYSTTLKPEDLTTDAADVIVGQETDSFIRRCIVGGNENLYIFKNNSIWQLFGRTPSTFEFRMITDKYGLAAKRGICAVGSGFVFLDEFTKELYFFGGTESSIMPLTERAIRLREILDIGQVDKVAMTVHKGLFRFAYKHVDDDIYQDRELIYVISEPGPDNLPKWSNIKGTKVYSYSTWKEQGDNDELLTGRSDTGKIMYHDRGGKFDTTAIKTHVRTAEVVASEKGNVRFKGFWVKGKPTSRNVDVKFNYYLNGRYGTHGGSSLNAFGEYRQIGSALFSTQYLMNNRIKPYHAQSLGNSISFEIIDETKDLDLEWYSISFEIAERGKIRNQLVGTKKAT